MSLRIDAKMEFAIISTTPWAVKTQPARADVFVGTTFSVLDLEFIQ